MDLHRQKLLWDLFQQERASTAPSCSLGASPNHACQSSCQPCFGEPPRLPLTQGGHRPSPNQRKVPGTLRKLRTSAPNPLPTQPLRPCNHPVHHTPLGLARSSQFPERRSCAACCEPLWLIPEV